MENDLGYIIGKQYWHQGYATEAAQGCVELAREKKWFNRVVLNMAHDHTASRRVAERLGATLETRFVNPKNRDISTNLFVMNL